MNSKMFVFPEKQPFSARELRIGRIFFVSCCAPNQGLKTMLVSMELWEGNDSFALFLSVKLVWKEIHPIVFAWRQCRRFFFPSSYATNPSSKKIPVLVELR